MKIIEQSHEILSYTAINEIELAGRTCYQSQDKIGCTAEWITDDIGTKHPPCTYFIEESCHYTDCCHHSSQKFVKMLKDRGHYAMIEFGDITVKFITNRGVTHELVRHRPCSYAQESTRYVKYDGDMEFILPVWGDTKMLGNHEEVYAIDALVIGAENTVWLSSLISAELHYQELLKKGWRPEQAREVLPNSLKTEIVVKANFREWMHILTLRCSKKAHPQMRALMRPLLKELKSKIPVVFEDIE